MSNSICGAIDCNNRVIAKGYCMKHYVRIRRGHEPNERTIYDLNSFVIYGEHAEIIIFNHAGNEVARALIDSEDVTMCRGLKWGLAGYDKRYVNTGGKLLLHRYITKVKDDMVVDHINHNPLDNRKSNLRICTRKVNMQNRKKTQINTSSGRMGVYQVKDGIWQSYIGVNNKRINLGCYRNKQDAIDAREKGELEYWQAVKEIL